MSGSLELLAQLVFGLFRLLFKPQDLATQLFLKLKGGGQIALPAGLREVGAEIELTLGDARLEHAVDLCKLFTLFRSEACGWRLLLQPFHGQFVS